MKRTMSLVLTVAFMATILMAMTFSAPDTKAISGQLYSPAFQKLDSDLIREIKANGKEIHQKDNPYMSGAAYLKPEPATTDRLQYLNKTGDVRGIAILVDFPTDVNGDSQVPGLVAHPYGQVSPLTFGNLFNGDTYDPYAMPHFSWIKDNLAPDVKIEQLDKNTLKNYFKEVALEKFNITIDVTDWYTLPHTYDYYMGQNKGYYNDNGDAHMYELIRDAIMVADSNGVDFSQYAVPGTPDDFWLNKDHPDKIVQNVFIIHRGTGAEYNTDPSIIWSHKWDLLSAEYFGMEYQGKPIAETDLEYTVVDGCVVNTYNICPEVGQDLSGYLSKVYPDIPDYDPAVYDGREASPPYIGVYAHEFSHVLGVPDQYDYGYESQGTGMFSLMSSGSYGRSIKNRYFSGNSPVHLDAWSKYYLGFAYITEVKTSASLTLPPVEGSNKMFKISVPGTDGREFFLLENRQQTGFDQGLSYMPQMEALHGLVVYHVIEDILVRNFDRPNEAANWSSNNRGNFAKDSSTGESHYAISVIQADGRYDMERGANDGDIYDCFPGPLNVTSLGSKNNLPINTSSFLKWSTGKNETGISLKNIKEITGGTITFDISFVK